ncbi:Protein of unknown function [Bacillus mycoides]|nr:Protein of unknown function [Bacillus mycoides]
METMREGVELKLSKVDTLHELA